jgi:glycosyltransferase involved in cell wall biosynthesis
MIPNISICIPAYKRVNFLQRLLHSIEFQKYKNFEVIITDDSSEDCEVENLIKFNSYTFKIRYFKNPIPLGSPRNWLECISKANGSWIKIMHDDDYFLDSSSLDVFASHIKNDIDCIFSGYYAVYDNGSVIDNTISKSLFSSIVKSPMKLFASNVIGPPSVMMFRNHLQESFDPRLKWIVDWEFYIRLADQYCLVYIENPLINVGYSDSQITNSCFLNPQVEIPETLLFTEKHSKRIFNSIWSYDAWWRLIRNLKIRQIDQFLSFSGKLPINSNILRIIQFQSYFPLSVLNIGFFSKVLMSLSFLFNKVK